MLVSTTGWHRSAFILTQITPEQVAPAKLALYNEVYDNAPPSTLTMEEAKAKAEQIWETNTDTNITVLHTALDFLGIGRFQVPKQQREIQHARESVLRCGRVCCTRRPH